MIPSGTVVKNPPASAEGARDAGLTPGSGRSPGEGNGNPLQDSCLENSADRGAWRATQSMASQSQTDKAERKHTGFQFSSFCLFVEHQLLFLKWNFPTHRGDTRGAALIAEEPPNASAETPVR